MAVSSVVAFRLLSSVRLSTVCTPTPPAHTHHQMSSPAPLHTHTHTRNTRTPPLWSFVHRTCDISFLRVHHIVICVRFSSSDSSLFDSTCLSLRSRRRSHLCRQEQLLRHSSAYLCLDTLLRETTNSKPNLRPRRYAWSILHACIVFLFSSLVLYFFSPHTFAPPHTHTHTHTHSHTHTHTHARLCSLTLTHTHSHSCTLTNTRITH
jgi:hypothetical protein